MICHLFVLNIIYEIKKNNNTLLHPSSQLFSAECDSGEWGENCENQCGHCLNGSCVRSDGTCDGGCSPGYKTTEMCTESMCSI
jgi:hypothetical protein